MPQTALSLAPFVMPILTLVVVPFVISWYKEWRAHQRMLQRKLTSSTEVVMFGTFPADSGPGKVLMYDPVGSVHTAFFGDALFKLIDRWNDEPSADLIIPSDPALAAHLSTAMMMYVPPFILQSNRLDAYFAQAMQHGPKSYRFARFVGILSRPDANKGRWHDVPRLIVVEEATLRSLEACENTTPFEDTPNGRLWLDVVRQAAIRYNKGLTDGFVTIEVPVGQAA
jgi:hypothetical protein